MKNKIILIGALVFVTIVSIILINNYIQEKDIMSFADSSARGSAVSFPEERMFDYLKDTNTWTYYDVSSCASYIGDGDITGVTITNNTTGGLSGGATAT